VPRSASIEEFDPLQLFVFDADVRVRNLDTEEESPLSPTLHELRIKYIDPAETPILPGHRYRVEVQVPGYDKLIWAETTVPQSVVLETDPWGSNPPGTGYSLDPDTQNVISFSEIDASYPIIVNTGQTQGSFNFFGETWCLEDFSTELEYTNPIFGATHPEAADSTAYNSGRFRLRRINFMHRFASGPLAGLPDNYLILDEYRNSFIFYGRYSVTVYIVDDNYYRYSYMPEGYFHGGVNNALGYVGSASGGKLYARIVK